MPPELYAELSALITVIVADLVLAGDNAVVVGMAAAGLPRELRHKAILFGIAAAARTAHRLRAIRHPAAQHRPPGPDRRPAPALGLLEALARNSAGSRAAGAWRRRAADRPTRCAACRMVSVASAKTLRHALWQIILADVSMSLDNVLVVAGTARHHPWVLVVRPDAFGGADGRRRHDDRRPAAALPLDLLCRPAADRLGRAVDDLGGRAPDVAGRARQRPHGPPPAEQVLPAPA